MKNDSMCKNDTQAREALISKDSAGFVCVYAKRAGKNALNIAFSAKLCYYTEW